MFLLFRSMTLDLFFSFVLRLSVSRRKYSRDTSSSFPCLFWIRQTPVPRFPSIFYVHTRLPHILRSRLTGVTVQGSFGSSRRKNNRVTFRRNRLTVGRWRWRRASETPETPSFFFLWYLGNFTTTYEVGVSTWVLTTCPTKRHTNTKYKITLVLDFFSFRWYFTYFTVVPQNECPSLQTK